MKLQKSMDFSACQLQESVAEFGVTGSCEQQVVPGVVDVEDTGRVSRSHPFLPLHLTDWME